MWESLASFNFKDLINMPWYVICTLVLLVALFAGIMIAGGKKWTVRRLAYAALCLAISFVLSCIRLYRMPSGGSVVLCSILPLVAFSFYCGVWQGLVLGVAYGLLQMLQGAWIIHPVQGFMDYIAAYAILAMGGLAVKLPVNERLKLPVGLIIAGILRWAVHVVSGMMFFSADALEAGQAPFVYSAVYNLFLFPEAILSAVIAFIPGVKSALERTLGNAREM
ncbi:MAG: energy-coupled thiamine transporter ThiT [Clostridia bacterium]|nr:energy-coupled thiamine transporter ThiT [Clostridia bacterium]